MLDITKYEYFELGLPNIKAEWDKTRTQKTANFQIDPRLKKFITDLATMRPSWTFVSRSLNLHYDDSVYEAYRFKVYDNREQLGEIDYEINRSDETVYRIHNHRILAARERGSSAKTKDIKKAAKLVNKSFGAKTVGEKILEAIEAAYTPMNSAYQVKSRLFNEGYRSLTFAMQKHLMSNWDETLRVALESGVEKETYNELPQTYQEHMVTAEIWEAYSSGKGLVIYISGKDYAIHNRKNEGESLSIQMFGSEDLPEWLRRNIGLLKLIEPKNYLRDVGFRISEEAFFLLDKGEITSG